MSSAEDDADAAAAAATAASESAAALERARGPRADLRAGMDALERAAAAPAPHRLAQWAMVVHDALVDVAAAFERHIAVTEGPEGLLEEIEEAAPRLATPVARMVDEHARLRQRISETLDVARDAANRTDLGAADDVRQQVTALMGDIVRHRQAGSDLVYEAYAVDIGDGD